MERECVRLVMPVFDIAAFRNYTAALGSLGAGCERVDEKCDPAGFDGLVLPGGGDVDPSFYGAGRLPECGPADLALDHLQMKALERFAGAGKPVLGICRGHQLINVCFGGTLIQHLPTSERHSWMDGDVDKLHDTRAERGSFVYRLYGESPRTNSSHHQAVERLGGGLKAVQWAQDGVIEAISHESLPVWGVQWHPERMGFGLAAGPCADGAALLRWFIETCKTGAGLA